MTKKNIKPIYSYYNNIDAPEHIICKVWNIIISTSTHDTKTVGRFTLDRRGIYNKSLE